MSNKDHVLESDQSFNFPFKDGMSKRKELALTKIFHDVDPSTVKEFITAITRTINALHSQLHGRSYIPDADVQLRHYKRIGTVAERIQKSLSELSELIDEAPVALKSTLRQLNSPVEKVQDDLLNLNMSLNEMEPSKSKSRPEIDKAVHSIAELYAEIFKVSPTIRAYNSAEDVDLNAPIEDRFVPALAEILDKSIDYAYRISRKNLCS